MNKRADVVVSGGGAVGCLAALILSTRSDLNVTIVETKNLDVTKHNGTVQTGNTNDSANLHANLDARVIALSRHSVESLEAMGLDLSGLPTQEIKEIQVSEHGAIGKVRLQSAHHQLDFFGKVVALHDLNNLLLKAVSKRTNIALLDGSSITEIERNAEQVRVSVKKNTPNNKQTKLIDAQLLLICDGFNSATRRLLNFTTQQIDYQQNALITNVTMQLPHNNVAFERFTSDGPLAFLPMHDGEASNQASGHAMSVVWCVNQSRSDALMKQSDKEFKAGLQSIFGDRLGNIINITERYCFPVSLNQSADIASHRALCLGNAAQSIHPIAGQGFNLGLRDAVALSAILEHQDIGSFSAIDAYRGARNDDKSLTVGATDALVRLFSNQYTPLAQIRSKVLAMVNKSQYAKDILCRYAMGYR